jgi:hypothetical protein
MRMTTSQAEAELRRAYNSFRDAQRYSLEPLKP